MLAPLKEFRRRDADRDDDVDRPMRVFGLEMTDQALLVVRSRETGEIEAFAVDHGVDLSIFLRSRADTGKNLRIKWRTKVGVFQHQDRALPRTVGCRAFMCQGCEQAGDQEPFDRDDHPHC
ncbi:hypothetical protein [Bradyrhizobium sp. WSM1417]|uniref:hypothetical protein n=1 Tax=Bradyrhizobium sp. WSM1417 TaxID=754500 RepID=UPI001FD8CD08|nr:hypothetical protein [Bradyrhizobium sp. WSM1417]